MQYEISKKDKILKGKISLPASKSISNRVLIIRHLCRNKFQIKNLSVASDTQTLQKILSSLRTGKQPPTINAGDGGTTFRFLAALLAITEGEWLLTGSKKMRERPVGILVEALKKLGAEIQYLNKKNYPPLKIKGRQLSGKKLVMDSTVSSQYISALLMIAPRLENGLTIQLKGKTVSSPYILMTLKIMQHFGIQYSWRKNIIRILQQEYQAKPFTVESDWSAASYFYEMAAFADKVDLHLKGLQKNSLQGDAVIAGWMKKFGVKTRFTKEGVHLTKSAKHKTSGLKFDFISSPDLAQTVLATCAGLGINVSATGIENLKIKETNRIIALKNGLKKFGAVIHGSKKGEVVLISSTTLQTPNSILHTYNDHRMAMSLAPLALLTEKIVIENPEVVKKSYPGFWRDLKKTGFRIIRKNLL